MRNQDVPNESHVYLVLVILRRPSLSPDTARNRRIKQAKDELKNTDKNKTRNFRECSREWDINNELQARLRGGSETPGGDVTWRARPPCSLEGNSGKHGRAYLVFSLAGRGAGVLCAHPAFHMGTLGGCTPRVKGSPKHSRLPSCPGHALLLPAAPTFRKGVAPPLPLPIKLSAAVFITLFSFISLR